MHNLFIYTLVVVSILLSVSVVIQSKGTGLSIAPGSGDFGKFEKRGPEKVLHVITIVLSVLFIALSVALFFIG